MKNLSFPSDFPTFECLRSHDSEKVQQFFKSQGTKSKKKKKTLLKSLKFIFMMIIVGVYFVVELVFGILGNSLVLVSDSFHMTSDFIGYIVGLVFVLISLNSKSNSLTYGWARSQIMGSMINSVFLLSVAYFILVQAINRFIEPEVIERPYLLLIIGGIGLVIDFMGLVVMGINEEEHRLIEEEEHPECCFIIHQHRHYLEEKDVVDNPAEEKKKKCCGLKFGGMSANIKAVFVHILGDFMGSIAVMISVVLFISFPVSMEKSNETGASTCKKNCFNLYVDPALSIVIVIILLATTTPVFIQNLKILLQCVPRGLNVSSLEQELLEEFSDFIEKIHEFHLWSLDENKFVCSMHVELRCERAVFVECLHKIKVFLHYKGIHSSTIQPEFKRCQKRGKLSLLREYYYVFKRIRDDLNSASEKKFGKILKEFFAITMDETETYVLLGHNFIDFPDFNIKIKYEDVEHLNRFTATSGQFTATRCQGKEENYGYRVGYAISEEESEEIEFSLNDSERFEEFEGLVIKKIASEASDIV